MKDLNRLIDAFPTVERYTPEPEAQRAPSTAGVVGMKYAADRSAEQASNLANALTQLGGTVRQIEQDAERRREAVGLADAERVANAATPEDWKTKTAVDLLTANGVFDTSNNPYAKRFVEKYRGQRLALEWDTEYAIQRSKRSAPLSPEEEAKAYQGFMMGKEAAMKHEDRDSFLAGFGRVYNQKAQTYTESAISEKSTAMDNERKMALNGSMGSIAAHAIDMPNDDIVASINKAVAEAQLAGATPAEIANTLSQNLPIIAKSVGRPGLIEDIVSRVSFQDYNGQTQAVGRIVNWAPAALTEQSAYEQLYPKEQQNFFDTIGRMTAVEGMEYFRNLNKTNPRLYGMVAGSMPSWYSRQQQMEQQVVLNAITEQAKGAATSKLYSKLSENIDMGLNGKAFDNNGLPTYMGTGALEVAHGKYLTGTGDEKTASIDPDMIQQLYTQKHDAIVNDSKISDSEKTAKLVTLYNMPYFSDVKRSVAETLTSSLNMLDATSLGKNYDPERWQSLTEAITVYRNAPSSAEAIYGKETSDILSIMSIAANNGGTEAGLKLYWSAKDKLRDTEWVSDFNSGFKKAELSTTVGNMDDVMNVGKLAQTDSGTYLNHEAANAIKGRTKLYLASGQARDIEQAMTRSIADLKETHMVFNGALVPRKIFSGIIVPYGSTKPKEAASYQYKLGAQVLQKIIKDYGTTHGITDEDDIEDINVSYDESHNSLIFSFINEKGKAAAPLTAPAEHICMQANDLIAKAPTDPEGVPAISFEEIEAAKAKHNKVLDILKHSAETRLNNKNKTYVK